MNREDKRGVPNWGCRIIELLEGIRDALENRCPDCNGTGKGEFTREVTEDGEALQYQCERCNGTGLLVAHPKLTAGDAARIHNSHCDDIHMEYQTLAEAEDKELFKEIFKQEWAKGKAEINFDHNSWGNCRSEYGIIIGVDGVLFDADESDYRLPLIDGRLPELKPLPCAIKLPDGEEWGEPYIECEYMVYTVRAVCNHRNIYVWSSISKDRAVLDWNKLQQANGAEYPKGGERCGYYGALLV